MKNPQTTNHLLESSCLVSSLQPSLTVNFSNFHQKNTLSTNFCLTFGDENNNKYNYLKSKSSYPTIVSIRATKMYASQSGEIGEFVITRNGDITKDLTVKYSIRGTAKDGVDYQSIANFAIVPGGANEVVIIIQPQKSNSQGTKTVLLILENFSNSNQYMLGVNFHAVVNILNSCTY